MKFVFDPSVLHDVALRATHHPFPEMFEFITEELDVLYPGYITKEREWVINNAGGAMGQFSFLYGSLREYLIFFGSPIGNQGHTGRFSFVEDWAFVLDGEFWHFAEGETERQVHKAGEFIKLEKGTAMGYRIVDRGWILEYARGIIPTMLPFGLADTMFSTLDYRTFFRTHKLYGKHVLANLRRKISRPRERGHKKTA